MRKALSVLLITALGVATQTGCAATYPLIKREIAREERGKVRRQLHVELLDGTTYVLTLARIGEDEVQGTTEEGESVSIPASDIRYAWHTEVNAAAGVVGCGLVASSGLLLIVGVLTAGLGSGASPASAGP
jgi:hypothetical protein